MATQVNTNQIKDDAVTPAKTSYTPLQVLTWVDSFTKLIDNDASETTIMSVSITGGTLGSTGIITGKITGKFINNSGAGRTAAVKLKYGATTLATLTAISISAGVSDEDFVTHFMLAANAGASAQRGSLNAPHDSANYGAAAEDSSGDLNLVITMQLSLADPDLEFYLHGYEVNFADPG